MNTKDQAVTLKDTVFYVWYSSYMVEDHSEIMYDTALQEDKISNSMQ